MSTVMFNQVYAWAHSTLLQNSPLNISSALNQNSDVSDSGDVHGQTLNSVDFLDNDSKYGIYGLCGAYTADEAFCLKDKKTDLQNSNHNSTFTNSQDLEEVNSSKDRVDRDDFDDSPLKSRLLIESINEGTDNSLAQVLENTQSDATFSLSQATSLDNVKITKMTDGVMPVIEASYGFTPHWQESSDGVPLSVAHSFGNSSSETDIVSVGEFSVTADVGDLGNNKASAYVFDLQKIHDRGIDAGVAFENVGWWHGKQINMKIHVRSDDPDNSQAYICKKYDKYNTAFAANRAETTFTYEFFDKDWNLISNPSFKWFIHNFCITPLQPIDDLSGLGSEGFGLFSDDNNISSIYYGSAVEMTTKIPKFENWSEYNDYSRLFLAYGGTGVNNACVTALYNNNSTRAQCKILLTKNTALEISSGVIKQGVEPISFIGKVIDSTTGKQIGDSVENTYEYDAEKMQFNSGGKLEINLGNKAIEQMGENLGDGISITKDLQTDLEKQGYKISKSVIDGVEQENATWYAKTPYPDCYENHEFIVYVEKVHSITMRVVNGQIGMKESDNSINWVNDTATKTGVVHSSSPRVEYKPNSGYKLQSIRISYPNASPAIEQILYDYEDFQGIDATNSDEGSDESLDKDGALIAGDERASVMSHFIFSNICSDAQIEVCYVPREYTVFTESEFGTITPTFTCSFSSDLSLDPLVVSYEPNDGYYLETIEMCEVETYEDTGNPIYEQDGVTPKLKSETLAYLSVADYESSYAFDNVDRNWKIKTINKAYASSDVTHDADNLSTQTSADITGSNLHEDSDDGANANKNNNALQSASSQTSAPKTSDGMFMLMCSVLTLLFLLGIAFVVSRVRSKRYRYNMRR